jgi:superfamily I DNA and RNA helicase
MIDLIRGSTRKTISSDQLVNKLSNASSLNGVLYVGYPILSTPEGKYPIDAIYISPEKGVVLINLVEGTNLPDDYKSTQDDIYNKLTAKLRNNKKLMNGRFLDVPIYVITFAPAISPPSVFDNDYPVCSENNLVEQICKIEDTEFEKYKQTLSVIQSISNIRKGTKKRIIEISESKGAKLQSLEDSIANLDNHQARAVVETIDDVQRIRGLAGSGKTIVLALKAAYLHAQHPDWKIAVTFNTRSLKEQFKRLINTFTIEQIGEEPNWDNLKIIHAWGSSGHYNEGIYHNYCMIHDIEYLDYKQAKYTYGFEKAFEGVCNTALISTFTKDSKPLYDVILIDEAQDFSISFIQICYKLLGDKKRLVYAYDELQSLNSRSLPSPEEIFGNNEKGNPLVKLSDSSQDIILKKCYRNSKPILTTAHALGFGIYRENDPKTGTGLIQMFDDSQLWKEVGYSVVSGELADGRKVTLERT